MSRLPTPGHDAGTWGDVLNDYLSQAHKPDGTLKDDIVTSGTIQAGAITEDKLDALVKNKLDAPGGTVTVADITDSTATGRALLTATDAAAARSAIGAGTSNLTLGTTSTTAKAGDYQPAWTDVTGKPGVATLTGNETLTNKTLTTPRVDSAILDANGNPMIDFWPNSDATDRLAIQNTNYGVASLLAIGASEDVDISLQPSGAGRVTVYSANGTPEICGSGPGNPDFNVTTSGSGRILANDIEVATVDNTPRYIVYDLVNGWPPRPADTRLTIFVGGAVEPGSLNTAEGDLWFPAS